MAEENLVEGHQDTEEREEKKQRKMFSLYFFLHHYQSIDHDGGQMQRKYSLVTDKKGWFINCTVVNNPTVFP